MLGKKFDISSLLVETLLVLALGVGFRPLVVRIQSLVENLFYQSMFVRRQKFIHFSREAFHLTDLSDLARTVVAFLKDTLSASHAELMVEGENSGMFRSVLTPQRGLPVNGNLLQRLTKEQKAYEIAEWFSEGRRLDSWRSLSEEVGPEEQQDILKAFKGGYIVPLLADKGIVGLLLIGGTVSGKQYTMDEEEFFAVFANEVSTAMERIMLMEKMRAQEVRVAEMEKLAALGDCRQVCSRIPQSTQHHCDIGTDFSAILRTERA